MLPFFFRALQRARKLQSYLQQICFFFPSHPLMSTCILTNVFESFCSIHIKDCSKVSYQSRTVSRVFNVKWEQESVQKGLNATSGDQFAALPLVEPDHRPARAVDNVVALSSLNLPRCRENHYASWIGNTPWHLTRKMMIYYLCSSVLFQVRNLDLHGKTCLLLYTPEGKLPLSKHCWPHQL